MQIVIEIPKEKYLYAKNLVNGGKEDNPVVLAIGNGTPLPKGHGRLVECERLQEVFKRNVVGYASFKQLFDIAPTIIEADRRVKKNDKRLCNKSN